MTPLARLSKLDPTRTTTLRKQFAADMQRRIKAVIEAIVHEVVDNDAFGLNIATSVVDGRVVVNTQFAFMSMPEKVKAFQKWFKAEVDSDVLSVRGGVDNPSKPWLAKYIESAYKKGMVDAYVKSSGKQPPLNGFGGPVTVQRVELLYTRAFEQLKGITSDMSGKIGGILASGLSHGDGPRKIASDLSKQVHEIGKKRAIVLARTEIIHSYAEGQLDQFEDLGIQSLGVDVEFSSTGDDRVCPKCASLSGKLFTPKTARGIIPVHPNCRCAWIPAVFTKGKKRGDRKKKRKFNERVIKKPTASQGP